MLLCSVLWQILRSGNKRLVIMSIQCVSSTTRCHSIDHWGEDTYMGTVRVVVCAAAILTVCAPRALADNCPMDGPARLTSMTSASSVEATSPQATSVWNESFDSKWCDPCSCECASEECCECAGAPEGCCDCYGCGGCYDSCYDDTSLCCLRPSDHCFDRFISPISNPFFFEDPRSLTEVRGIYINNQLPGSIDGGDANVWAGQVRLRFAERWSVIAPRLGYLDVNQPGGAPAGYMSSPVGLKYNFYRDACRQQLASVGVTYFIPGSADAFSDFGDGDFHFFLTGGAEIFDEGHWLSATGFRIPTDHNWGTQLWYWSNQWDYEVADGWYGLLGVNWFHWMRSAGVNIGTPVTGLDLMNLPVGGVAGDDVVTGVVGTKFKPNRHVEIGVGYEFPMTNRTDILENRLYADLIFRY